MSLATANKNFADLHGSILFGLSFKTHIVQPEQQYMGTGRASDEDLSKIFNSFILFIFLPRQRILLWRDEIPEKTDCDRTGL